VTEFHRANDASKLRRMFKQFTSRFTAGARPGFELKPVG
jgi:hypothetical protein